MTPRQEFRRPMQQRTRMIAQRRSAPAKPLCRPAISTRRWRTSSGRRQLAPGQADAHYGLARAYLARNQLEQAAAEFQTVLAMEPRNIRALNGTGIALDLLGQGQEAQNAYRAALAIAPDDRAARNNLGLSLMLSGDYDGPRRNCRCWPVSPTQAREYGRTSP